MGIAGAEWGWSANQFWHSTPHEFFAAYEVWTQMLRVRQPQPML
jgi:hypothetical protein